MRRSFTPNFSVRPVRKKLGRKKLTPFRMVSMFSIPQMFGGLNNACRLHVRKYGVCMFGFVCLSVCISVCLPRCGSTGAVRWKGTHFEHILCHGLSFDFHALFTAFSEDNIGCLAVCLFTDHVSRHIDFSSRTSALVCSFFKY